MTFAKASWVSAYTALVVAASLSACGGGSGNAGASPSPAAPAAGLLPVVDATKIPAAAAGWNSARVQATSETTAPTDVGAFRLGCNFSHMAFDDPLVFPGKPGASHLHTFVGNTGANANSTGDSIANTGNSTCSGGTLNRTAYWFPTMIDTTDGTPIAPSGVLVYYKTGYNGVKPADVKPVPNGLRMIAGIASNAGEISWQATGRFSCVGGVNGVGWQQSIPANCYQDNQMIMEVDFPQCWDGLNLDSPDHKSHMAHATPPNGCPSTHPVALPEISYTIYYDLAKVNLSHTAKWRLSSDNYASTTPGGYSAHGDYVMGWDEATMLKFIKNCENPSVDCHANLLGDGTTLY